MGLNSDDYIVAFMDISLAEFLCFTGHIAENSSIS
jgi:hypothetical protein